MAAVTAAAGGARMYQRHQSNTSVLMPIMLAKLMAATASGLTSSSQKAGASHLAMGKATVVTTPRAMVAISPRRRKSSCNAPWCGWS